MINGNELRIGNLVKGRRREHDYTFIGKVEGIGLASVCIELENYDFLEIHPIPITEEWLIKSGFENVKESIILKSYILNYSRDRYISVSDVATPNMMIWHGYRTETEHDVINIWNWDYDKNIHVHQLQNIVFALTGTELTFNL